MVVLRIFLILFMIFDRSHGCNVYEEGKKNTAERKERELELMKTDNVTESNYMFLMNLEIVPPTNATYDGDVILECLYLEKDRCRKRTFHHCLRELAKEIPKKHRCQLPYDRRCDCKNKYRSLDGSCNNLENPNLGKADTAYDNLLEPDYSDGISAFRKTVCCKDLPNPREMGNEMKKASHFKHGRKKCGRHINNVFGLMVSQLFAHDASSRRVKTFFGNAKEGIGCCGQHDRGNLPKSQIISGCTRVKIPKHDKIYGKHGIECQDYIHLQPTTATDCKVDRVKYGNLVTSFFDLDPIYSNTVESLNVMRVNGSALFNLGDEQILPLIFGQFCAGDFRFNQTPALGIVYSIFYLLHNLIAEILTRLNSHWSVEKVFQEARRITIAIYQHLIYYKWLPLVLGKEVCRSYGLISDHEYGYCGEYDRHVNPTILNEFANAAFRWYHAFIPKHFRWLSKDYKKKKEIPIADTYLSLSMINDSCTEFLQGIVDQPQEMYRLDYTEEIRSKFVQNVSIGCGADTLMLDILRGRNAGIPHFSKFYEFCGYKKIESWHDLKHDFEPDHYKLARKTYKHFKDMDFMFGILAEKRCGNFMGKIGGCLVAEQFRRSKYGDRFFYCLKNNAYPFTPDQLREIKRMTPARLLCMLKKVHRVPRNAFIAPSDDNPYIDCCEIKSINWDVFKDKC